MVLPRVLVERRAEIAGDVAAADGHVAARVTVGFHHHHVKAAVHIRQRGIRLGRQRRRQTGGAAADHQHIDVHVVALLKLFLGRPVCQVRARLHQAVAHGAANRRAGESRARHRIHRDGLLFQNARGHFRDGRFADEGRIVRFCHADIRNLVLGHIHLNGNVVLCAVRRRGVRARGHRAADLARRLLQRRLHSRLRRAARHRRAGNAVDVGALRLQHLLRQHVTRHIADALRFAGNIKHDVGDFAAVHRQRRGHNALHAGCAARVGFGRRRTRAEREHQRRQNENESLFHHKSSLCLISLHKVLTQCQFLRIS